MLILALGYRRWRRIFTVSTACGTNMVNATGMPAGILRMPRNQSEGDIPLTAISTGDVDAMECVLLKMGVDAAEFTPDTGGGRIHIFSGYDADGGINGSGAGRGPAPARSPR